jgi:asparagine synthase (glutamine-hydrolysing)
MRHLPGFHTVREKLAGKSVAPASNWFTPDVQRAIPAADRDAWTMPLSGVLAHGVERRPLPLYLRVEDRNSMSHSVEARVPFLDYRLVSLAFSLSGEWKLRGGWNKYLVREALKGVIAENVRTRRDKMGFPTPSKDWWGGAWYEPMMDLLQSQRVRTGGFCDVPVVVEQLERHRGGQVDASGRLFRVAEFGIWLEQMSPVTPAPPVASAIQERLHA